VAKDKLPKRKTDAPATKPRAKSAAKTNTKPKAKAPTKKPATSKLETAAKALKARTAEMASSPVAAEIVAATLVAAAAALKDPKKARRIAESAADEIKAASAQAAGKGGAMWLLALEVARRSIDALATDKPAKKAKKKKKKK